MRIAQVIAGARMGGAEGFYERLTCALHAEGEEVLSVIRADPGRAARLAVRGLAPLQLRFGSPWLDWMTRPRLSAALRRFQPQVVVSWMNRATLFTPRGGWTLVGRLGGYYDLKHYRHCDHLVGNTRDLVRWMVEQGQPAERVHYLPNFVEEMGGVLPAELPLPAEAPRLLAMGRLHRNKGFDTLLRALPHVPGAHLALAGEGPERATLEALARELGVAERVHFLGWRQDAGALLAACDVFVCSSRHEPLGNIVLEAWSAARPVVAIAAQGPSELIREGETGLLVPQEAPEALGQAIAGLLAAPQRRAALAEAGRAAYLAGFAEAPVLARWRGFLQQVAPAASASTGASTLGGAA
ncbi:glycosyltransferase [Pseudoroseomonas cervicalis]|uniref:glycosyltransferase n=1 Tax=Teichococcus cervicalis TaxID=204525 RepID=UPI002782EFB2|nr:glycosyltransferase [Pseudoroseomonas cervicalis]MDQ1080475.1 glycosyltransferase involved in cell wall biosynthesis [Pseudoroseomonas cervicalis]